MTLSSLRARCALLLTVLACWAMPGVAAELRIVTEEFSPYNMTAHDTVTGMSTEVVEAVLKQAGIDVPAIQVMPWARAYDLALHEKNVLIYSITRNADREKLFDWVGSIVHTHTNLYSTAARPIHLNTLNDARAYQIGTVKEDVGEQFLLANGFELGHNLQSSYKYEFNYEKLKSGRVDLWISDERNALYLAHLAGDDPNKTLVASLLIDELGDDLNMAFSLGTDPGTVERCRQALAAIHQNGVYDAIMRRWL